MSAGTRATRLLTTSALLLVAVSCASRSASTVAATGPPTPSVAAVEQVWVAVLGIAGTPDELSSDRAAVLATLGDALEGSVVVSPVGCLEGLPPTPAHRRLCPRDPAGLARRGWGLGRAVARRAPVPRARPGALHGLSPRTGDGGQASVPRSMVACAGSAGTRSGPRSPWWGWWRSCWWAGPHGRCGEPRTTTEPPMSTMPMRSWCSARPSTTARPSPLFQGRLDHAALLWKQGRADVVITVGSKQAGDRHTEAEAGRDYLIDQGVPADQIVASRDRAHDASRACRPPRTRWTDRGLHSVFLVSDPWHNARIEAMAADLGLEATPRRPGPRRMRPGGPAGQGLPARDVRLPVLPAVRRLILGGRRPRRCSPVRWTRAGPA